MDNFIINYYKENLNKIKEKNSPPLKYINFRNLNYDQKIFQLSIEIKFSENLIIKTKIDWNLNDEKKSPEKFSNLFVENLAEFIKDKNLIEFNKTNIKNQIFNQLIEKIVQKYKFPKFHIIRKKNEINGLNELCPNCGTIKYNNNYCINCLEIFQNDNNNNNNKKNIIKKKNENNNTSKKNNNNENDVKRLLTLRQKNPNLLLNNNNSNNNLNSNLNQISFIDNDNFFSNDNFSINNNLLLLHNKKLCKKCNEINNKSNLICKNCNYKFPIITCYDIYNNNNTFCTNFWDKINKNNIISQIKDFQYNFEITDFYNLRYLYNKIKFVLKLKYEKILTKEAYDELILYIDNIYNLFSKPSKITQKIFDKVYENKFGKKRPINNYLNINDLEDKFKIGFLPENDVNEIYYINNNFGTKKKNIKIYDNIAKNFNNNNIEDNIIEEEIYNNNNIPNTNNQNNTNINSENQESRLNFLSSKRTRGRPKKIEIFREKPQTSNSFIDNIPNIIFSNRTLLMRTDIKMDNDLLHFDFCGKCELETGKLICCETCSSAYHFYCIGYEKIPRGKFKCYFCKIVKNGRKDAVSVSTNQIKLIDNLFKTETIDKWFVVAEKLLFVVNQHQCASFFKDEFPKEIKEYYEKIKEPKDLKLIEIKLKNFEYKNLDEFLKDLNAIWKNIKIWYNDSKSFFWRAADSMEIFINALVNNEKLFERFDKFLDLTEQEISDYKNYLKIEKEKKIQENINSNNDNFINVDDYDIDNENKNENNKNNFNENENNINNDNNNNIKNDNNNENNNIENNNHQNN